MSGRFRRDRHGFVTLTLGDHERALLANLLGQLVELVAPEAAAALDDDPLARAVGIGTATAPPADPALARLFPDAYRDDPEAAADFRRYTELGLRETKATQALTALETLERLSRREPSRLQRSPRERLTDDEVHGWLGALNDLRLTIGTRLEVTEEAEEVFETLAEDDPRRVLWSIYLWLGGLQDTLVQALSSDAP